MSTDQVEMPEEERRNRENHDPFVPHTKALKGSDGNMLSDPQVVYDLLEYNVLAWRDEILQDKDPEKVTNKYAKAVAKAFLGKDKDQVAVHRWNEPGGIDQFMKRHVGTKETKAQDIMEHMFIKVLEEVADIAARAGSPGVHVDQYSGSLKETLNRWSQIFTGVPPHHFVA
jgi:hypothetical protein